MRTSDRVFRSVGVAAVLAATTAAGQPAAAAAGQPATTAAGQPAAAAAGAEFLRQPAAVVELVAGGGTAVEGRPATECRVTQPFGIAFSPQDDMFICEETHRILRVDGRTGVLSVVTPARPPGSPLGDGGPAAAACFSAPHTLVADRAGNLYIADTGHHRVRRIDARTGIVTTVAGDGSKELAGDGGPAVEAGLDGIACVCLSPDERLLYVGGFSRVIRVVDMASGVIRTLEGLGGTRAFAVDAQGRLFSATGRGVRMLGDGARAVVLEDPAAEPVMKSIKHLWADHDGDILLADEGSHLIRKFLVRERRLLTIAGTGVRGTAGVPGDPLAAQLGGPHGVVVHPRSGDVYIADSRNHRVLRIRHGGAAPAAPAGGESP